MSLSALIVRNNVALRSGGGFEIDDVAEPVILKGVQVEGNTALMGGAVSVLAVMNITITADDYGRESVVESNTAVTGAGVYVGPGHDLFLAVTVRVITAPCTVCQ